MKLMSCPDCDCDYRVTHKGHLQRHIQEVHKGVKFPCEDCESTFHVKIVSQHLLRKVTFRYTSDQFIKA